MGVEKLSLTLYIKGIPNLKVVPKPSPFLCHRIPTFLLLILHSMGYEQIRDMGWNHTTLQSILAAPGVKGKKVTSLSAGDSLLDFIQSTISNKQEQKNPFYILDLGVVASLMDKWNRSLSIVRPFYAVKCNPEPALLGALAALGAGFDCASQAEIEAVLALGVSRDRIVYANPCKGESHIKYAASVGVNLTTFDSLEEIQKLQKWNPNCELLLRLKVLEDGGVRTKLGSKYGALPEEVRPLLQACHTAGLVVVGVSFHVGSAVSKSSTYRGAIAAAKKAFDTATRLGMPSMRLLDIGGGFTATSYFNDVSITIKEALKEYFNFPNEPGLTVISEPGRFFAETAFTLTVNIIGKRVRGEMREYWINDGIYNSMICKLTNHATVTAPIPLVCSSSNVAHPSPTLQGEKTYNSTVWGPTCDSLDKILTGQQLPELRVNDWLVFPTMGAYTIAVGSNFNGFYASAIPTHLAFSNLS